MEIPTPRQLLRSLGPLPETSARTPPELPRSPSRSGSSEEAGRKIVLIILLEAPRGIQTQGL